MSDGDELLRCLAALQRAQAAWLSDLATTCHDADAAFAPAFRRWQEQLAHLQWHLHRGESRLLHFVMTPQARVAHQDPPVLPDADHADEHAAAKRWQRRLAAWFAEIHLATTYRRLENVRDLDGEALNADIITDLVLLAELAEQTAPVLLRIAHERNVATAQDLAFYGVIAPWRVRGLPALHAVLRWLSETLIDEDDW